jgi:preprotein translocase subunit SecG
MQTVLIVIHLMIVLALVGVVLIQRSEGGGLGIGGGSGFMSARGTANALTRTTAILATLFFVTSLGLAVWARYESKPTDILDRLPTTTNTNDLLNSLSPQKTEEKKPADPNAIPLGDDSSATTPAVDTKPATTTTTEEKPADPATDTKPADNQTKSTTEEKPAQPQ